MRGRGKSLRALQEQRGNETDHQQEHEEQEEAPEHHPPSYHLANPSLRTIRSLPQPPRPVPLPTPSEQTQSSRRTPKSRSTSPRKPNLKTLDQPRSAKNVDLATLRLCKPALLPLTSVQARQRGPLPPAVDHLVKQLQSLPPGLIPSELKPAYDAEANTPMKSRPAPHSGLYLRKGKSPFPAGSLHHMKERVAKVVEETAWNNLQGAHEKQWGKLVAQLVGELELLPYGGQLRFMNIETCAINPEEIRPTLPDDTPLLLEPGVDDGSSTYSSKDPQTMGRMVDWTFGVKLADDEMDLVNAAFGAGGLPPNACSLNQTLQYPRFHPLFLDIEIKKSSSLLDPKVQLAIWKLAGLKKMLYQGWDIMMPMPAIAITGQTWEYYIFYPADRAGEQLIMMGPEILGSTAQTTGVWEILYRLDLLIRWGITDYGGKNIVNWARELTSST